MEIATPFCRIPFGVSDAAHVDGARRAIVRLARELCEDETLLGKLTVVVQEMARNLVNHAGGGELLYSHDEHGLNVLAVDTGPGMASVSRCLADSYSTTGTMGTGLGAIQRMSDHFDIFSQPGQGTVVYAGFRLPGSRVAAPGALVSGAVCTPYPGEEVCGDAWAVKGNRMLVVDGLGHGYHASQASQKARQVFLDHDASVPLEVLMERLHRALTSTRGGAAAIAEIQPEKGQVQFCGIGNIAGSLFAGRSRSMVSGNGTVGYRIGRIQTFSYPWDGSGLLIMASDGISTKCDLSIYPGLVSRHPAVIAALIHRDFKRLNDDATVAVVKRE